MEKSIQDHRLPEWAPRVPKGKVGRLYQLDAQGIYDDELLMEVGYGLRARCQSFIDACRATRGEVQCPVCGRIIHHHSDKNEILSCKSCSWSLTWGEYFATIQHRQLSGAEPVLALFRRYVDNFPLVISSKEKMLMIDELIHGWHWSIRHGATRPVAVNLLDGKLDDVVDFLDQLSLGPQSTSGLTHQRDKWMALSDHVRKWREG